MSYEISLERFSATLPELHPIYARHYAEMKTRLEADGHKVSPFAMRIDQYVEADVRGYLLNYVVRLGGSAVGYCNVYLTNDMHNGDLIAEEDAIYILPEHRKGIGQRLVKHILGELKERGVCRVHCSPVTDLRVGKVWRRMGFKEVASLMIYDLEAA